MYKLAYDSHTILITEIDLGYLILLTVLVKLQVMLKCIIIIYIDTNLHTVTIKKT